MKEFICQFIQRLGTMFSPCTVQEEASKSKKENAKLKKEKPEKKKRFTLRKKQKKQSEIAEAT